MMNFSIHSPQIQTWQARLARMPRWGWIAFFIGVVLPVVVIGVALLVIGVLSGLVVMMAVAAVGLLTAGVRRLLHRPKDDGRRNVQIVVRSARVIDP